MPKSDRRLYLNADRSKVVDEDSPDAAYLFVTPGKEVSAEDMKKYGLKFGEETKAQQPAENKSEQSAQNKAETPDENKDEPSSRTRRAAS